MTIGLNFGIDFRGGTTIEVRTPTAADLGQIRGITSGLGLGDVVRLEVFLSGQTEDRVLDVGVGEHGFGPDGATIFARHDAGHLVPKPNNISDVSGVISTSTSTTGTGTRSSTGCGG